MAPSKKTFRCTQCGNEIFRWLGKCPQCGAFDTLEEVSGNVGQQAEARNAGFKSEGHITPAARARTINELSKDPIKRFPTGIEELDRVLGGGFVAGEVVLFAGHPGAGKSTLSLAIADKFAQAGKKVLYSSGEENEQQIGLRAQRLGVSNENIKITNETNLETLLGHIELEKPELLIVDSLQTLASTAVSGSMGGIAQGKEAAHVLTITAKRNNITMVIVNQINKAGELAGSEAVQHIVDCALLLESDEETPLKFLRAHKNRFGEISEVGVFQHTESGLAEVSDPSGIFLEEDSTELAGTACSFITEGLRQIPVEVQSLVSRSTLPTPRKQFNGVNYQRGQIVCAILDKFCKTSLFEKDVFLSTVSGIKVNDPQADLAVAAAVLSSSKDKPIRGKTVFVGELGLTGLVRGSFMMENKIREAQRLGFDRIVIPQVALKTIDVKKYKGIKIVGIGSVTDLPGFLG